MKNLILTYSASACGTIKLLFKKTKPNANMCFIGQSEDYSHGPLLSSGTSRDFFLERQAFWKSLALHDLDILHQFDRGDEHTALVNAVQTAAHTEIWFTNSVQEVFYVVVLLHLLRLDGVDTSTVFIRDLSGSQVRWGLGSVPVDELELMYQSSKAVSIDAKFFSAAWGAISEGSPEAISRFVGKFDVDSFMAIALSAFLLRFPVFNGGLGSIDRALLGAGTAKMKKSAYTVGTAMALGGVENDLVGDLILFRRLVELSRMTPDPWFEVEGDPHHMRSCSARLTESGKEARTRYAVQVL